MSSTKLGFVDHSADISDYLHLIKRKKKKTTSTPTSTRRYKSFRKDKFLFLKKGTPYIRNYKEGILSTDQLFREDLFMVSNCRSYFCNGLGQNCNVETKYCKSTNEYRPKFVNATIIDQTNIKQNIWPCRNQAYKVSGNLIIRDKDGKILLRNLYINRNFVKFPDGSIKTLTHSPIYNSGWKLSNQKGFELLLVVNKTINETEEELNKRGRIIKLIPRRKSRRT